MTTTEMSEIILGLIKLHGDLTFAGIMQAIGDEARGDQALCPAPNLFMWAGMSQQLIDALEIIRPQTELALSNVLRYLCDGEALTMPVAKRPTAKGYKEAALEPGAHSNAEGGGERMRQRVNGPALVVHTDGRTERVEPPNGWPADLEWMQKLVGGYIESVRMSEDVVAVINEEGRLPHVNLPDNARYPNLAGPIVLCSPRMFEGEDGDPPEPDLGPLSEEQLRRLEGGGRTSGWSTPYMERTRTLPDEEIFGRMRIFDPSEEPKFRRGKG